MAFVVDTKTHDLTAGYGPRKPFLVNGVWTNPFHYAMDFAPEQRGTLTKTYAPKRARVLSVGTKRDAGRFVIAYVPDWNKWIRYCHLSSYGVRAGQELAEAQYVGKLGATGNASGVHLHFEVYEDEGLTRRIDPKPYIWHEPSPTGYAINGGKAAAPVPAPPVPPPAKPRPSLRVGATVRLSTPWRRFRYSTLTDGPNGRSGPPMEPRSLPAGDYRVTKLDRGNPMLSGHGMQGWVNGHELYRRGGVIG